MKVELPKKPIQPFKNGGVIFPMVGPSENVPFETEVFKTTILIGISKIDKKV